MHTTDFDLSLEEITKIEGAAALEIKVRNEKVEDVKFIISEYKRFYTQGVRGKHISAVPQLVARVCGTCSNAHLLCSIKTIEAGLHIQPSDQTLRMRRLAVNALMIRDHGLHLYIFSLPDLLKKDTILEFDEHNEFEHQLLHDIFTVKAAGNQLSIAFGGRSVHAPFMTVGGFLQFPDSSIIDQTVKKLQEAKPAVLRLIDVFSKCPFSFSDQSHSVALIGAPYDFLYGTLTVSDGRTIPENNYKNHLQHVIIPYSQASGYKFEGDLFKVGAIARLNLAVKNLHPETLKEIDTITKRFPSSNIYDNNLAQAIEILHCIDDSLILLHQYPEYTQEPLVSSNNTDGIGIGVIEAPRGTLYHGYTIENKIVTQADIIVPTGQNQIAIEKNIALLVEKNLHLSKEALQLEIEKLIRAYDPCMSCASHFLKIRWN